MDKRRREFIKNAALSFGLCATTAAAISSCEFYDEKSPVQSGITHAINISDHAELQYDGFAIMKSYDDVNYGIPVIIVRLGEGDFVCFSSLCTHSNCFGEAMQLPRPPQRTEIGCNCHGSKFDPFQNGKAVKGPAERALKSFPTEYDEENGLILVHF
jgi:Rieske Fe-S protein